MAAECVQKNWNAQIRRHQFDYFAFSCLKNIWFSKFSWIQTESDLKPNWLANVRQDKEKGAFGKNFSLNYELLIVTFELTKLLLPK